MLVAISDSGIIRRPDNPELPEVCKADQVPDRVYGILKHLKSANSLLSLNIKNTVLDLRPDELERITQFFLTQHRPLRLPAATSVTTSERTASASPLVSSDFQCRSCKGTRLTIQFGHSYYFKCLDCDGNTPARAPCGTRATFFTYPQAR